MFRFSDGVLVACWVVGGMAVDGNKKAGRLQTEVCPTSISFTKHEITTSASGADSVFVLDVNGDGHLDVISASYGDGTIRWHKSDGASPPQFTTIEIGNREEGATNVHAADLNGDGYIDILTAANLGKTIAWYRNNGDSTFSREVIDETAEGPIALYAADVDGDGDLDVLSASCDDDTIALHENDGDPVSPKFAKTVLDKSHSNCPTSVFAVDIDEDGDVDVLAASSTNGEIYLFLNSGETPLDVSMFEVYNGARAYAVSAADLDNDGKIDIISGENGAIAWHTHDGAYGTSIEDEDFERRIVGSIEKPWTLHVADVNNDGAPDVLAASPDDNTIAWFRSNNRLAPNFFPEFEKVAIDESASGATSLFAIDLDGDGDVDVVATSYYDNTVAWYESNCISRESPPAPSVSTLVPTDTPSIQPVSTPAPVPSLSPTTKPVSTHTPSAKPVSTPVPTYAPSTEPMSTPAATWQPSESLPTSVSPTPQPSRPETKKPSTPASGDNAAAKTPLWIQDWFWGMIGAIAAVIGLFVAFVQYRGRHR